MQKKQLRIQITTNQKRIIALLIVMAVITFILMGLPNSVASQNLAMVQMFEPDEAAQLPYVIDMIAPAPNINQSLHNFVFYEYYFYGFPFFGLSALVLLPLKWLGMLNNIPLVMLVLRQMISVLPMLAAFLLLIYMQDRFRTYRSPLMFIFLISIPAVLQNNFWWHPDGIIFLMAMLVIFFLHRDNLRFGWNFVLAAVMCGIATATKLVGVYFFLAVGATLFAGLVLKKASFKKLAIKALVFILVMAISFVMANPFLLSHWARTAYSSTFKIQLDVLSSGYGIIYEKGLKAAWPLMHKYYGEAVFIISALAAALWGLWQEKNRGLFGLIVAWFLPVSVVVLWITHFKFQYWLPVALPLFSCLLITFPENNKFERKGLISNLTRLIFILIVFIQFIIFARNDASVFVGRLQRADNNPRIQFYDQVLTSLKSFEQEPLYIYYDYRLYLPEHELWRTAINYDPIDYEYIQENNFDVLILLQQRIRDYLNPHSTGIDPATFANSQQFYSDAQAGKIQNYHLLFNNDEGKIFIREDIYMSYTKP